jgi:hypothetical protein
LNRWLASAAVIGGCPAIPGTFNAPADAPERTTGGSCSPLTA